MKPEITRVGLAIKVSWEEHGAAFIFDRMVEKSGEMHAEVRPVINGANSAVPSFLTPSRVNLHSVRARGELTKRLTETFRQLQHPIPADNIVDQSIHWAMVTFRQGEPAFLLDEVASVAKPFVLRPIVLEGLPSVVFALAAKGKSMFGLLACLLAETGQSLGGLTASHSHQTAFLDWELDSSVQGYRKRQILAAHPNLRTAGPIYRRMTRALADDLPNVAKVIEEHRISFIVVDSLAPAAGGDQIGAEGAIRFFEALRILNVGCLILAHAPKPNENTKSKSIYGSIFFHNLARSVWEVETSQEPDSDEIRMGFFHRKNNLGRLHSPVGLQLKFPPEDQDGGGLQFSSYDLSYDPELSKALPLRKQIATALECGRMTVGRLAEMLDVDKTKIRARLNDGRGKFFVQFPGKNGDPEWGNVHRE